MRNKEEQRQILAGFQTCFNTHRIHRPKDIKAVLKIVRPFFRFSWTNKKHKYFNVPCSFDIETSSFYGPAGKTAVMYVWSFCIFGIVIIGRTWDQFVNMIHVLSNELDLNENKRLVIYVHNLAYEFQFMRKWFEWGKVFAIKARTPIYALTDCGIEFRCSYLLSGYSLEKLAEQLQVFHINKLVGSLDYEKIRHSRSYLSYDEILYSVNDVKVVVAYIYEKILHDGDISRIPLTKTGYVRNYCRNSCFYEQDKPKKKSFKRKRYSDFIHGMKLSVDEYKQLKRAFQGGFTHANAFYVGKVMTDVTSYDFTSSYPAVMIAEEFPMSSAQEIEITTRKELDENMELYCCLFDIQFTNLHSVLWQDHYISRYKCFHLENPQVDNGRIVSADLLETTITEQDFKIIEKCYTWDSIKITNFRRYRKAYLPTDFIKAILQLYSDKTTLKGVAGKEVEYLNSKEMLNSCYGMCVTDPIREEYVYTDHWLEDDEKDRPDYENAINKYNSGRSRFLFYPWGVWVTAYARRNLYTGILATGHDYIYSDTDSIKIKNVEKYADYVEKYNELITSQLQRALTFHGLEPERIRPKTVKGEEKPLGVWDFDGHYTRFKTLGAKRYMIEKDNGRVNITVAGLNKKKAVPFLCDAWYYDLNSKCYVNDPFEKFNDGLDVSPEDTGKMTHTYIDDVRAGTVVDYTGNPAEYKELSAIHMEKAGYNLSLAQEFADYLLSLED